MVIKRNNKNIFVYEVLTATLAVKSSTRRNNINFHVFLLLPPQALEKKIADGWLFSVPIAPDKICHDIIPQKKIPTVETLEVFIMSK